MLNILSAFIGLIALIMMIPTIIPFTGWINWIIVPIALFGALVGLMSSRSAGQNFCLLVAGLGVLRLFLGGGFI
ncbi:MAG: hypothetical protein DI547_07440 [Sphingobium sp.]|jgi:hypothetical protein|nr:MAG: hypothetical protein DI547_07440 [Sphingobium sp.]